MTRIFVSYSRKDKHLTQELKDLLEHGFDVWYDTEIPGGADWWHEIVQEIEKCDCFIYLLSPESVTSQYCLDEFHEAQKQEKFVLPVLVREGTNIPEELKSINYVQLYNDKHLISADGISHVYGAIVRNTKIELYPQLTEAHRQADLRRLRRLWPLISADTIEWLRVAVAVRTLHMSQDQKRFIWYFGQFLTKRYDKKNTFNNIQLEKLIKDFEMLLKGLHGKLENVDVKAPPSDVNYDALVDTSILIAKHKEIMEYLHQYFPEFDFDSEFLDEHTKWMKSVSGY